ncbi:hypothetical protein C5B42_01750 [Candidatus Cerribacteria bacterium 'Amazon FNV 2010 28 9']|uniref:Uncharacterized protein n=1 Tax=Candidatus Cerribacteria bacterium 'Amazon FNV 2010 28 9' TaxID=2081795 RepID=A0A317JQL8_9BACT|nr:MAG: hypothetical protein C5B42_01750 [Candidatus Cerribacteria bacterium 'Amazon FNV 2010 28 9']
MPTPTDLHTRLSSQAQQANQQLQSRFPNAHKKLQELGFSLKDLRRHSANILSAAAIAGGVLATAPIIQHVVHPTQIQEKLSTDQLTDIMKTELSNILPQKIGPLSPPTEDRISDLVNQTLGINVTANLDGNHLITTYGYIGQEQHLPRYPGDTVSQHDALQKEGITAGLGGFGYFAPSKSEMTEEAYLEEKYYVAVPIMYLPNWSGNVKKIVSFYKFRKMLVINPKNGKSIIADIADAGPAGWTGKSFGGSPELMQYLNMKDGKQKGPVVMLFIDESNQKIALGPVEQAQPRYIAKK